MSKELKPCPFCGQDTAVVVTHDEIRSLPNTDDYEDANFAVCCNSLEGGCGATSGYNLTRKLARKAWNKRSNKNLWNKHTGEHCPVLPETFIAVQFKEGGGNGIKAHIGEAQKFDWEQSTPFPIKSWKFI